MTVTTPATWAPVTDRKAYIVWIALICAGMVVGFGLDFTRYAAETPPPPLILHLHGAAYATWLILVAGQVFLVESHNIRLHKQLGWAVAILSGLMVPLGLVAAMVDQARDVLHADYEPQFLGLEFQSMIVFPALIGAGLIWRKDPAAHKRLMVLAAVALSDAGFSRAWDETIKLRFPGPAGWWFHYFWGNALVVLAMIAWDLWRRKRIHPSVLGGAALLASGELVAVALEFSPAWRAAMVRLVAAWGYAG